MTKNKSNGLNQKLTLSMQQVILFVVIFGFVAGVAVFKSFAAPANGKGGSGGSTSGSCSVSPNPVAVGAQWTVTGSNLGANAIVDVLITDSAATTAFNIQADASGNLTDTWHSYNTGTSKVTMKEASHNKQVTVANCSFTVN